MSVTIAVGAVVGAIGLGAAHHGAEKAQKANETIKEIRQQHEEILQRMERENASFTRDMDSLGRKELEIMNSFEKFSDTFEKIKNRPEFKNPGTGKIDLPVYNAEELKQVWVGANVLLGALSGAAAGTAGGFAASGAAAAAVISFGTASTGTAISTLTGAALTNATLAALGGGTLTAGGGGIAVGTMVLGATTLGVGLLIGGVIFNFTGSKLSEKAEEARRQVEKEKEQAAQIHDYIRKLQPMANRYKRSLDAVAKIYYDHMSKLTQLVEICHCTEWKRFTPSEKQMVENTVLLVDLLYEMCKVKLVVKSEGENALNTVNTEEAEKMMERARSTAERMRTA